MARRLTAARARVATGHREAYLAAAAELAARHRDAGGHFWLFEREEVPGEFLEFAEHAAVVPGGPVDPALAARLAALAAYDASRDAVWREVPLATTPGA